MRVLWGCLFCVVLAFAAHPPRPACSKRTDGRLWPEEANADRSVALRLMRSGEVYVCSYGRLWYRWEPLSVDVKTLEGARLHPKTEAAPKTGQAEARPTPSAR